MSAPLYLNHLYNTHLAIITAVMVSQYSISAAGESLISFRLTYKSSGYYHFTLPGFLQPHLPHSYSLVKHAAHASKKDGIYGNIRSPPLLHL